MSRLPLIGITKCSMHYGPHACHISRDVYPGALISLASGLCASRMKPVFASDILDGIRSTPITVTTFNIEPIHNDGLAITRQVHARDSARPARRVHLHKNTIACR
ncbi:hypothetical protein D3C73_1386070 [compost metagenome]